MCKNFLATLLQLADEKKPRQVKVNVQQLIQGLIDNKVNPEDFETKVQKELNSPHQFCFAPFLSRSLPYLQESLVNGELSIEGVNPPLVQGQLQAGDCEITDTPPKRHLDVVKFTEDSLKTPESLNRPNLKRKRKIVEKMGIDDVKLTDVVFSPKVKITPFSKHQHLMETTPSTSLTKTE